MKKIKNMSIIAKKKKIVLVVDGYTLNIILESQAEIIDRFFNLGFIAKSCICCRVSPKQKADV